MPSSWLGNTVRDEGDSSSSVGSEDDGIPWLGHASVQQEPATTTTWFSTNATPGTLAFFQAFQKDLQRRLVYPDDLSSTAWLESLQCYASAHQSRNEAQKLLDELNKSQPPAPQEAIEQATKAVQQANTFLQETHESLLMIAESLLTSDDIYHGFLSPNFDDRAWVTYVVLCNPQHWADWCCPDGSSSPEQPDPVRVAMALDFLNNVSAQRRILGEGGGGPRHGNYGGYLEILHQLNSSSATTKEEPVLERLAQAVALEFADRDYQYFDTTHPIDPVSRFIHYEQAYLMGDLDPAFSTLSIWELRLAVNSPCREWELQWGRECLQTYRPDWIWTTDEHWRYCRLVKLDVGYTTPTWTSSPKTMDQILSGGGKCGPRAWFGRFMCQAFGIPIWGVRQPGHAAMSRWTSKGWMICLGAAFQYSWWEDRCGLDFQLETLARNRLPTSAVYLQRVMRLEWLAAFRKESNKSILKDCVYDPAAPWYALSLAQRHLLAKTTGSRSDATTTTTVEHQTNLNKYPFSTPTISKIVRSRDMPRPNVDAPRCTSNGVVCIPADNTCTAPSKNILVMPSFFDGGHQVFLGADAVLEYELKARWLPSVPCTFRLSAKVATAHAKETVLLVTVKTKQTNTQCGGIFKDNDKAQTDDDRLYRLPLPYTKGLWQQTKGVDIVLSPDHDLLSLQREWQSYGISIKELCLERCH